HGGAGVGDGRGLHRTHHHHGGDQDRRDEHEATHAEPTSYGRPRRGGKHPRPLRRLTKRTAPGRVGTGGEVTDESEATERRTPTRLAAAACLASMVAMAPLIV